MKIEHVAIWVEDIDKVCEFYRKYFGGVVQPLYHNPTKKFTSRFITFDDGARLEIMHRPDINIETLTESMFHVKRLQTEDATKNLFFGISEVQQVGSEGANPIASVASGSSLTDITEHENVRHDVSQHAEHIGLAHVSFSVGSKEKVDQLTQQMSDDGITIVGQPRTTGDGYYESVVLDPEGNRIEITV